MTRTAGAHATRSQDVSAAVEEQTATTQEISASVSELVKTADELRELISEWKV